MITVNLLPTAPSRRTVAREAAPARSLRLPIPAADPWMVGLGTAGAVVLLFGAYSVTSTSSRKAELNTLLERESADSVRFASTIELVKALEARQDTIEQKIQMIQGVDERRFVWPHLLDEVSGSLPAFTWLASLKSAATTNGEEPTFTLQGNALSTQALTRFMKSLESSPFIKDVTLVTSEQVVEEGLTVQRFTLEARYQKPIAEVLETVPIVTIN